MFSIGFLLIFKDFQRIWKISKDFERKDFSFEWGCQNEGGFQNYACPHDCHWAKNTQLCQADCLLAAMKL